MAGIKHLIECHCYLALYKNSQKPINHKFCVYSKVNDAGDLIPKVVKCNNCDALHYVFSVCKSEIKHGKDQTEITLSIDDIAVNLPKKLTNILMSHNSDISNWEHALDIFESKDWGKSIVLKREIIDENTQVKILYILGNDNFKISNETIKDIILPM